MFIVQITIMVLHINFKRTSVGPTMHYQRRGIHIALKHVAACCNEIGPVSRLKEPTTIYFLETADKIATSAFLMVETITHFNRQPQQYFKIRLCIISFCIT